ncbi:MAG: hypothetical protein AB7G36_18720 [Candidatus Nanopelagicales bacterium]
MSDYPHTPATRRFADAIDAIDPDDLHGAERTERAVDRLHYDLAVERATGTPPPWWHYGDPLPEGIPARERTTHPRPIKENP